MTRNKQNPDFLHIGTKILNWYQVHGRDLPFRKTNDPYKIWICEIVFQQTRIQQGIGHYNRFVNRFPDIESLANADQDDVLHSWKGLGYYSRAINVHKAAKQIQQDFSGKFPQEYEDILKLKGVGKYTAAAVSSICFGNQMPAVDGNFYRVLSRIFADDFDISNSKAFEYFSELSYRIMPENKAGDFNQAMMDLGSEICKPRNPLCSQCPVNENCIAFQTGKISEFPVKIKKTAVSDLILNFYFIQHNDFFLIKQRGDDFIWKKLYDFPQEISGKFEQLINKTSTVKHKLTHKNLEIHIHSIKITDKKDFEKFALKNGLQIVSFAGSQKKSFPKPLEKFLEGIFIEKTG